MEKSVNHCNSGHDYMMIGVGDLVAREVLGEKQVLLEPFRFDRYQTGKVLPISSCPFPWS
jgi:methylglutamate dehydrogenase subunit A